MKRNTAYRFVQIFLLLSLVKVELWTFYFFWMNACSEWVPYTSSFTKIMNLSKKEVNSNHYYLNNLIFVSYVSLKSHFRDACQIPKEITKPSLFETPCEFYFLLNEESIMCQRLLLAWKMLLFYSNFFSYISTNCQYLQNKSHYFY